MNSSGTLKIARNGYIVMAVVFCALGIFLMAVPEKAVKIICVLAGILFLADGIIKIIGYFSRDFYCLAFQFDLGFGILMIAVGILILVRRESHIKTDFRDFRSCDSDRCIASDPNVSGSEKIRFEALVGSFAYCSSNRNIWNASSR